MSLKKKLAINKKREILYKAILILLILSFPVFNDFITEDIDIGNSSSFINSLNENSCSISIIDLYIENYERIRDDEILLSSRNLEIFPEYRNIFCIGTVTDAKLDYQDKEIYFIGTSGILHNFLEVTFFLISIFLITISKNKNLLSSFFYFFLGYGCIYFIFDPEFNLFKLINPIHHQGEFSLSNFLIPTYLIFVTLQKDTKNKFRLFLVFYLVFFFYEFFGIFVVLIFLFYKFDFGFSNSEKQIFKLLPIIFYFIRIISSLFSNLQGIWTGMAQKAYIGTSKFYDSLYNFISFNNMYNLNNGFPCNESENICSKFLAGGPLSTIGFQNNPEKSAIAFGVLSIVLLLVFYIICLRTFDKYYFFIVCLFISPPINFLTFLGNDDLLIALLVLYIFSNYEKNFALSCLLVLVLALFQLHPIFIFFGLIYNSIYLNSKRQFIISCIFFISTFIPIFNFVFLQGNSIAINFGSFYDYGFLSIYNIFTNSSDTNNFYIGMGILLSILFVFSFTKKPEIDKLIIDINFYEKLYNIFSIWFLGRMIFANASYSLPIFYFAFFIIFVSNKQKNIQNLLIFAIFLSPTYSEFPDFIANFLLVLKEASLILIFLFIFYNLIINFSKDIKYFNLKSRL